MGLADRFRRKRGDIHDREQRERDRREGEAYREDMRRLRRDMERQSRRGGIGSAAGKIARGLGKGFGDIGESLNTPSTRRRPRISQMPAKRPPIAIQPDLEKLKPPGMRGQNMKGRR